VTILRSDSSPALDDRVRVLSQGPANVRRRRLRRNLSAVDALEMAPGAEAGDVFVRVVAAVGAEAQVMWRDVASAAAGTLTAVAVTLVDVRVLDFGRARAPGVDEELGGKTEERRVAERGTAVAQINGLVVPEISGCVGVSQKSARPPRLAATRAGAPGSALSASSSPSARTARTHTRGSTRSRERGARHFARADPSPAPFRSATDPLRGRDERARHRALLTARANKVVSAASRGVAARDPRYGCHCSEPSTSPCPSRTQYTPTFRGSLICP